MNKHTRQRRNARVVVPKPDRIRDIKKAGFGWLDARIHNQGWLELLPAQATAVYTFLCLAANRQGVSWYRRDRIGRALGLGENELHMALRRLYELDLVAYRPFGTHASDGFHQVLSLPEQGPPSGLELLGFCGPCDRIEGGGEP